MNLVLHGNLLTLCAGLLCGVWQEKHQHEQAGGHITGGKIPRLWPEDPARHQRLRLCVRKGNRRVETASWSKRRWGSNFKRVLHVSYDGTKLMSIKVLCLSSSKNKKCTSNGKNDENEKNCVCFKMLSFLCFRLINQLSGKSGICLKTETFLWPQGGLETCTYGSSEYKTNSYYTASSAVCLHGCHS